MGHINALNDFFSSIASVNDKDTNFPSYYSLCDEKLSDIVIWEMKFLMLHVYLYFR